jgi:hypothetical protein
MCGVEKKGSSSSNRIVASCIDASVSGSRSQRLKRSKRATAYAKEKTMMSNCCALCTAGPLLHAHVSGQRELVLLHCLRVRIIVDNSCDVAVHACDDHNAREAEAGVQATAVPISVHFCFLHHLCALFFPPPAPATVTCSCIVGWHRWDLGWGNLAQAPQALRRNDTIRRRRRHDDDDPRPLL